jgi:hypothetical protein
MISAGFAGLVAFAGLAQAQQFQNVAGALGGPSYTTKCEGVEVVDLNGDGKLDIVGSTGFVLNPGGQGTHIPQIQINTSTGPGVFTFVDEATTRLPAGFAVQAGGCTAFDIDNDGDADLLFAQMGGRQPQLLLNNGSGIFTNITATNFPTINMSSPCAQFGDVDNDGDLDVAMSDQSQRTRLFMNNGAGVFTDVTVTNTPNITLSSSQDVSLVDVDNDWDLDMICTARSGITQKLYLNNGSGVFTDATATLGYTGSGNNYESDWADLDNDGDLDGFWVSVSGFNEGSSKNNLIESGILSWTTTTSTVTGGNGDDDNEISFIDTDNNGRLDIIVSSLGSQEKLYATSPAFTFAKVLNAFTTTSDPSLDGTPGDFDNDGRVDFATAVGESGTGNKVFKNTGNPDNQAPKLLRVQSINSVPAGPGPFVFRTMIQDSSYDDGQDFIDAKYDVSIEANNGLFNGLDVPMRRMGGHLFRGEIDLAAIGASVPGARVTYTPKATDRVGLSASASSVSFQVQGYLRYDVGAPGNTLDANGVGILQNNSNATFVTTGCLPVALGGLLWANGRANFPNFAGFTSTLLIDPVTLGPGVLAFSDGTGTMTVVAAVPNNPAIIGITFDFQTFSVNGSDLSMSNGLEAKIAP